MKKLLRKLRKRPVEAGTSAVEPVYTSTADPRLERFGLFFLADGPSSSDVREQYPVDIIAVHGLNGDAYTTWTHENGTLWLRDLLPKRLPGCRVFSYGYPSQAAFSASFATVQEYARMLLSSIRDNQDDTNENPRSIIFICHSLGGIVCKQALVCAHEDDFAYSKLLRSVAGVVFLGTPHDGSDVASLASTVGKIINLFSATASVGLQNRVIRTDLLDYLKSDSRHLHDLKMSVRNRLTNLTIVSFYESEVQPPLTAIVDSNSAVLGIPKEEIIPLYANHRDVCRFAGETNDYRAVSSAIRRIAKNTQRTNSRATTRTRSSQTLNDSEKSCIRLFSPFDISDYQMMLPTPAKGTCQWLLSHPLFIAWLEKAGDALLWLTGHPGCGKTVLSFFLAKHLENVPKSSPPRNVCIFFCDDKITKQNDAKGVLIGLILQLISRHRSLVRHASKAYDTHGQNILRSFTALWQLFETLITDPISGPTYIIIDAIDECEEVTRHALLKSIRTLLQTLDQTIVTKHHIKFVVTSRPFLREINQNSDNATEHRIPIDEGQRGYDEDVRKFVRQRVGEISKHRQFSPELKNFLEQTLCSKSGQTFLWNHMILASLENSPLSSKKDLQDVITRIPPDLEMTYLRFFSAIPLAYQDKAAKLLKLVLGSSRPLTLDEINIAFTIDNNHRRAEDVISDCQPAMRFTLQAVLGPLVRVFESKVALVHQSAKEFALQHLTPDDRFHPAIRGLSSEDCSLAIASTCIDYLLLDDFAEDFFKLEASPTESISDTSDAFEGPLISAGKSLWDDEADGLDAHGLFKEPVALAEDACQLLVSKYVFYRYAALHWTAHFVQCEASAPTRLNVAVKRLLDINVANCSNWLQFYSTEASAGNESIPSHLDAITLAAYFNLHPFLKDHLGSKVIISQAEIDHALFWGSDQGHSRVVDTLLQAGGNPNARVSGRQTAVIAAFKNGHHKCAAALLTCPQIEWNLRGKSGRTALSFACGGGYVDLVQMLLSRDNCKADEEDDSGATALFWATGGGHIPVVSLLVRNLTVNVNHRDKKGRTALSWAAGDGMDEVLKTLLRVRHLDVNLQDNQGRSPLSWAAGNGCTTVVEHLMKVRMIDKASVDNDLRNAISWACAGGHVDTLRELLKRGCPGIDDRDVDGWSPLAWAIQNNSPPTVETLIASRSVNLEQGDHSGRTPLTWAVAYGHLDVVRTLLQNGANPSARSRRGSTPMSIAKSARRNSIIEELLHHMGEEPSQEPETSCD